MRTAGTLTALPSSNTEPLLWGTTQEEAYRHIHEVVQMIIEELNEDGIALPETSKEDVEASQETKIAITV